MLSVHTSPLEQPGTGDAGGMNVYVVETATRMARRGVAVEIFTRATSSEQPPVAALAPGVLVRHVAAGPFEGLGKNDLPSQLCAFTAGVLRAEARHEPGYYDVVHSHYWLSGQVGWLARDRWGVPLVHSAHTLARVKNAALADGDEPEPMVRVIGEDQVVAEADRLIGNTDEETRQLVELYDADPQRTVTIPPGVDLARFRPGSRIAARAAARPAARRGGARLRRAHPAAQGPGRAAAGGRRAAPPRSDAARTAGGARGGRPVGQRAGRAHGAARAGRGAGHQRNVRFLPPQGAGLVEVYRAADVVAVPSHNESFGLVALEAQACGTPVVAARVGGLPVAVADGTSGLLVPGHRAEEWADALAASRSAGAAELGEGAVAHARAFSWDRTADALLATYTGAATEFAQRQRGAGGDGVMTVGRDGRGRPGRAGGRARPARPGAVPRHPAGNAAAATPTWLVVREQALFVQAFVCRRPDEEHEAVYRFLLQRNARLYGVHYTLDRIGDIHLVGRVPLSAVSTAEIDRVLGQVLEAADGDFNTLLELGFATSIRREYAWRTERGRVHGQPQGVRAPLHVTGS